MLFRVIIELISRIDSFIQGIFSKNQRYKSIYTGYILRKLAVK